jgi:hypothetical protein
VQFVGPSLFRLVISYVTERSEYVERPPHSDSRRFFGSGRKLSLTGALCVGRWFSEKLFACTICVSVASDGLPMHPRCRRVTATVARHAMSTHSIAGLGGSRGVVTVDRAERRNLNAEQ